MRYDKKDRPYLKSGGPRDQQRRQSQLDPNSIIIDELKNQILELKNDLVNVNRDSKDVSNLYTAEQVDDMINTEVAKVIDELSQTSKAAGSIKVLESKINKLTSNNIELLKENELLRDSISNSTEVEDLKNKVDSINSANTLLINEVANYENKLKLKDQQIIELEALIKLKDSQLDTMKNNKTTNDSPEILDLIKSQANQIEELKSLVKSGGTTDDINRPKIDNVVIDPSEKGAENRLEAYLNIGDVSITKKIDMENKVDKLKALMGRLK